MLKNRNRRSDGFSLVELLIVVVVLGIMSTIVVFAARGATDHAQESSCSFDKTAISRAEEAYRVQNAGYGTEAQLVVAGLLRSQSVMHDVSITGDDYTVVPVNQCAGGSAPATTAAVAGPNQLVIAAVPPTVTSGATITAITVTIKTAAGATVTSSNAAVSISLGTNPGGATLSGTTTVNAVNGVATFTGLSLDKAGTGYTFAATASGATSQTSAAFTVNAGAATKLGFTTSPANGFTATAFGSQPVVAVLDANGNVVTTSAASVTLAITAGSGTSGAALTCTANPKAASAGVATFAGCKINLAGTGYKLTASATGLTAATTSQFNLSGVATKVVFTQQPTAVVAGAAISPAVVATVQDAAGNTVTASNATVTISISTNPGGAALSGVASVTATNGVATFGSLSLDKTGTGYKLTIASTGLTSAVSSAFNVTVGTATKLSITQQPAGAKAGVAWTTQPKVTVLDALGNVVTNSVASITLSITPGTGAAGAVLTCTANPKAASAGVATFAGCKIDLPGSGYTLTASATGLDPAQTAALDNPVGPATKVVISQQPTNAVAGVAIAPTVTVTVQDAVGNTVTSSNATVTIAISTNPAAGTLSGTASVTVVNGVATFSGLSIDKAGSGYKFTASSTGLTSAVSSGFNITPAAAAKLVFTQQPVGANANAAFGTQPKVTVQDAFGNTVTSSTASISISITSGTGTAGAVLTCTANPKAAASGVATFAACKISKSGSGYTLTATATGLTSAVSTSFVIS